MSKKGPKSLIVPTPETPQSAFSKFSIGVDKPSGFYDNRTFKPTFSFLYIKMEYSSLCFNNPDLKIDHFHKFLSRLQVLEGKTYQELRDGGKQYRFHDVKFESEKVSVSFINYKNAVCKNPDKVIDDQVPSCYQLDIAHKIRVMGYLGYNGIFYLVWCDADHEIYS